MRLDSPPIRRRVVHLPYCHRAGGERDRHALMGRRRSCSMNGMPAVELITWHLSFLFGATLESL
jgi:hypothetical protein